MVAASLAAVTTVAVLRAAPAFAATYASTVLADSPVAYWRLSETSGTSAADSSGNSHGGTYTSTGVTYGAAPDPVGQIR